MSKVALITGASGGIGHAFAEILAKNQYQLILIARSTSKLSALAEDLHQRFGVDVHPFTYDLTKPADVKDIYHNVLKLGIEVDVLINNAGLGDWGYFIESNWEKQERMLQLNINALTHLTKLFLPGMIKRGAGKILNVASTAAFQPGPLMSVYFATKAYVLSLSSAIGYELKGSGVTVTCLCPGPTATGFQTATFTKVIRLTHGRKLPTAHDVADYGYRAMMKGKAVAVPGLMNKFLVFSSRFLPQELTLHFVYFLQESK